MENQQRIPSTQNGAALKPPSVNVDVGANSKSSSKNCDTQPAGVPSINITPHASPGRETKQNCAVSQTATTQTVTGPTTKSPVLPLKESLGYTGGAIIIAGTVGLLGVLAFVTFLWFGYGSEPESADATWVWRQLALKGYMDQAITLAALVLTVIMALQATVCSSMMAALLLEKCSVPKSQAAFISVLRGINDGPGKLLELMLSSKSWVILLRVEFWLMLLLGVVDLTLQFSSTILLSDMHDYTIMGNVLNRQVASLVSYNATAHDLTTAVSYYDGDTGNAIFPVFGEAQPINASLIPDAHGFSDTGLVRKGFLPLSQASNRTTVRKYSGNAMVLDARTPYAFINLVPGITARSWDPTGPAWSLNNSIFLVFSTNMGNDDWDMLSNGSRPLGPGATHGEWRSFELFSDKFVNVSMCFLAYSMDRYHVHMNTSGSLMEPSDPWSVTPPWYDTTDIRRYLGLIPGEDSSNYTGRNILQLDVLGEPQDSIVRPSGANLTEAPGTSTGTHTQQLLNVILGQVITEQASFNVSFGTCFECSYDGDILRGEYMLVLEDILDSTGRAASMLQSVATMTAFWIYSTMLASMGTQEDVQMAVTSVVRAPGPCRGPYFPFDHGPRGCPGYISVTVLLGVHLITVAIISVMYVRQSRFSRCANIWHTVAQLAASDELGDTLGRATRLSDNALEKQPAEKHWVKLFETAEGKVELRRMD